MEDPSMSNLLPSALRSQKDVLFGNMPEIYQFHSRQDTHAHTHTHKLSQSCPCLLVFSCKSNFLPFPLHLGSSSRICRAAWRHQRGWGPASYNGWGKMRRNIETSREVIYDIMTHLIVHLCVQKEKFQVYERYCQNKPRSELLWRQCSDSPFFKVVTYHICMIHAYVNHSLSHIDGVKVICL